MFKHILIPTDVSPRSARAIKAGLRLALETGARITGYYAADPVEREAACKHLAPLARAARAAGVPFDTVTDTPPTAYEGIVRLARRLKCDAIVMASHGRGGLASALLGSVTQEVLARSKLPVMVTR
jgi:nucleotide-binding universal stress UspA family protein